MTQQNAQGTLPARSEISDNASTAEQEGTRVEERRSVKNKSRSQPPTR